MTWKEIQSSDDCLEKVKSLLIERFKEIYKYTVDNKEIIFSVPGGYLMKIFTMHGKSFSSLGMNYKSDIEDDDGDLFYPEDFEKFDDMFSAMLEETKR